MATHVNPFEYAIPHSAFSSTVKVFQKSTLNGFRILKFLRFLNRSFLSEPMSMCNEIAVKKYASFPVKYEEKMTGKDGLNSQVFKRVSFFFRTFFVKL